MSAVKYMTGKAAELAMNVVVGIIAEVRGVKIHWHNGTAIDADIFKKIIRIPRVACASMLDLTSLMLMRGRVYHEAGHILFTKLPRASFPQGALMEIWNAIEDRWMEAEMRNKFPGAAYVLPWQMKYYNEKIAKQIAIEGVDAPLWEALCAMGFMGDGMVPKWRLTPKAQLYFDAGYDTFVEWKTCKSSKGTLKVAKKLYDILKEVNEQEKQNQPQPQGQGQGDDQEQDEQGEPQESEGQGQGEPQSGDETGEEQEPQSGGAKDFDDYENDEPEKGKSDDGDDSDDSDEDGDEQGEGGSDSEDSDEDSDEDGSGSDDSDEDEDGEDSQDASKGDSGEDDTEDDSDDESASDGDSDDDSDESGDSGTDGEGDNDGDEADEADGEEFTEPETEDGTYNPTADDSEGEGDADITDDREEDDWEETALSEMEDGKTMDEVANEELADKLCDMAKDSDTYTARRDLDEHIMPTGNKRAYLSERAEVNGAVMTLTRALDQALRVLAQSRKQEGLRKGRLDNRRLIQAATGLSKNVFFKERKGITLDTVVSIVIDESGSMWNMHEVRRLVIALGETLTKMGIEFEVVGTTTKYGGGDRHLQNMDGFTRTNPIVFRHYKVFGEKWEQVAQRTTAMRASMHNVDGEAVEYCALRLATRKETRKVIFSICDGEPYAGHSNEHMMAKNLRDVCKRVRKEGIEVYGFGLGTTGPKDYYGEENFVYLKDGNEMGQEFVKRFASIVTGGQVKLGRASTRV